MRPLDGVTVVSLEQAVAAPLATRQLADLGARVVKVERPGEGDFARGYDRAVHGEASYFVWLNRGKESLELDLKDDADRALLDRLLDRADVLVQNLAPGAVDRLGLDAASVRADRPRLVHVSLSGYGGEGPYAAKKAYDLLLQCETGLLDSTGSAEEPAKVGVSVADIATGSYAAQGVLAALLLRGRTGEGSTLEVSMLDALGDWMMQPAYYAAYGDRPPRRSGPRHASIAPYGPYRTGGETLFLGVQNDREWAVLCREVLGRPELVEDERFVHNTERVAHDEELTAVLEEGFAGLVVDDLAARLDEVAIANARVRTAAELLDHPQLRARDRWRDVALPDGSTVPALLPPIGFGEPPMGPVPALGEHNASIRAELEAGA